MDHSINSCLLNAYYLSPLRHTLRQYTRNKHTVITLVAIILRVYYASDTLLIALQIVFSLILQGNVMTFWLHKSNWDSERWLTFLQSHSKCIWTNLQIPRSSSIAGAFSDLKVVVGGERVGVKSTTHLKHHSVQLLHRVQLFVTPWTAARQASLSITNSRGSSWSIRTLLRGTSLWSSG